MQKVKCLEVKAAYLCVGITSVSSEWSMIKTIFTYLQELE